MIINLIGFGSIGKRHLKILLNIEEVKLVNIFTRKKIDNLTNDNRIKNFDVSELDKKESFLTIIATSADVHIKYLKKVYNKSNFILVEKPFADYSFSEFYEDLDPENKIFVGYNLRFSKVIQYLKKVIRDLDKSGKLYNLNVLNTSHIQGWRDQPLSQSISLDPNKGGGALLELSHDIDLVNYLMSINFNKSSVNRINLPLNIVNIDSSYHCLGLSKKNIPFSIFSSFSSHIIKKKYYLDTKEFTYEVNLIKNTVKKYSLGSVVEVINFEETRDDTFLKQIKNIININSIGDNKPLCSFKEALSMQRFFLRSKWL